MRHMFSAMLCLILITAFATGSIAPVEAEIEFTLHATVTENPYYGYYGGYHDIWAAIKPELAKIGIQLEINQYDDFTWYERVWDPNWNKTWGEGGWDMTMLEWWLQPHAPEPWFTSMVYSWMDPWPLPEGYNIGPWKNEAADEVLWKGMHSFNATERKIYLWRWQEEFMHDPPWANIYYPQVYEVMARYLSGYEPSGCWFYDVTHLALNNTMLAEARPDRDLNTVIYAVSEEMWGMSPMFMDTYTEEQFGSLCWRTLYRWSVDPFPPPGVAPALGDFVIKPDLAADYPTLMVGPNGPDTRVRVRLREAVWSDGEPINASDVKWTFDTIMIPAAKASGVGDFSGVIESVEIVNATCVDFILFDPYPDILSVIANDWGTGCPLPWHFLKDISVGNLKSHPSNTAFDDPSAWMPVSGPYKPVEIITGDYVRLEKNTAYYGYGLGWGPYNASTFILDWIPDAAVRLLALQTNDVDFGEYPTAPVETFHDMMNQTKWPYLTVMQYDYPASNPVWFNFDNPYLSNRYVRLAIAHAIPYQQIIGNILPSWGIESAHRGKTYIMPHHYYTDENGTTEHLYNEDLEAYEGNITKAQMYMNMWKYSQVGTDYTLGPLGDADFNGLVEFDDFYIWARNFGTTSADWDFLPGQDIDPDFDNTDYVEMADFYRWTDGWGEKYPFPGAR